MNKEQHLDFVDNKDIAEFKNSNFNYNSYIIHTEMSELVCKIVEEFQYLEKDIRVLLKSAVEKEIYNGHMDFTLDKVSAKRTINALKDSLIENKIADKLIKLIEFRNYLIHEHYINSKIDAGDGYCDVDKRLEIEESFPMFLFMIFEARDYLSNVINTTKGIVSKIPNIFEVETKKK
ncbi:MAG: hypothetical protein PHC46_04885 [Clostridia bacterium]|nr:hypothetical protein [Clostridia bacterium]